MKKTLLFLSLLVFSCTNSSQSGDQVIKKQISSQVQFQKGIALKPDSELLSWLQQESTTESGKRILLKVPVFVKLKNDGLLTVEKAFIGSKKSDEGASSIFLELDDSTLGISLATHLKKHCAAALKGCALWLEGYWGVLLDLPRAGGETWPFTVRKFIGDLSSSSGADHIWIANE